MAEITEAPQTEQPKELDTAGFIAQRNAADAARKAGKEVPRETAAAVATAAAEGEPDHEKRKERSSRRALNRANQAIGEERARNQALEAELQRLRAGGKAEESAAPATSAEGKPLRSAFPVGEAGQEQYLEAIAEHKAEQILKERDNFNSLKSQIESADAKAAEDSKNIPNWSDLAKKAEGLQLDHEKHPSLLYMIRSSPVQAPLLAYFAENEEEFDDWMDMKDGNPFIVEFHRLEGAAKTWYRGITKKQAAAGAEEKPKGEPKDRVHPAEAQAGRTEVKLPKPSSEVSAKSGSAPPSDPPPGSKAWMDKRNEQLNSRGY